MQKFGEARVSFLRRVHTCRPTIRRPSRRPCKIPGRWVGLPCSSRTREAERGWEPWDLPCEQQGEDRTWNQPSLGLELCSLH